MIDRFKKVLLTSRKFEHYKATATEGISALVVIGYGPTFFRNNPKN